MMGAVIKYSDYYLPATEFTNKDMAKINPDWQIEKIFEKTGIKSRRISAKDEFSVDLGVYAAKQLIENNKVNLKEIDFILFCTQTPKYLIPGSACIVHEALGLGSEVGAIDINLGCSGFVYALMLAETLVAQKRARNVLLITADTYTKIIDKNDRKLLPLFGDGASASLITYQAGSVGIKNFEYGTDGSGAEKLISQQSGMKGLMSGEAYKPDLYMNGGAIFKFALEAIPELVGKLLKNSKSSLDQIDHFIFHQANCYMLEHLREKIGIDKKKFIVDVENIGNTVSSSIPIVLHKSLKSGHIKPGDKVVLVGFGVGLSWSACLIDF
jgi:3-oxoacyl-[acyl-carrier-protein] synthase-3